MISSMRDGIDEARRPSGRWRVWAIGVLGVAAVAISDLQVRQWKWSSDSLGPSSHLAVLCLVYVALGVSAWLGMRVAPQMGGDPQLRSLVLFLLVAFVGSVLASDPSRSLFIWLGFCSVGLAVFVVVRRGGLDAALFGVAFGCVAISLGSLMADRDGMASNVWGRLSGIAFEPNLLGQLSGLGLVCALVLVLRRRLSKLIFVLPAVPLLTSAWQTGTRTTWPALGVSVLVIVGWRYWRSVAVLAVVTATVVIGFGLLEPISDQVRRSDSENLTELRGRVDVWEWSLAESWELPVFGHGMGSGREMFREARSNGDVWANTPSSHNLVLEILRESGALGLGFLLGAVILSAPWRCRETAVLFGYLAVSGLTMPTTGLPGLVFAAWVIVIAGPAPVTQPSTNAQPQSSTPTHQLLA
ncbi:MAG: O-antigen ligase [Candidatus Poriferisodalaceae bacterium]|jgi:O-antigen ligase